MPTIGMTAAALILLTACGGGGGDNGSDKIPATQSSTPSATASASSTASTTSGVTRPVITFPADAKNVFEGQHTGDPKKDAVLADNAQMVDSIYAAIIQGDAHTPAMAFYSKGMALGSAAKFVQGWVDGGASWTGTIRWFDRKVTLQNDESAVVIYCSDESKAFTKSRTTGKVDRSPSSTANYVLYNTRLEKSPQGVWQTVNLISERGAKVCKP